jgi:DNA-binding transcriptional regulator GbsR (MarR family)
MTVSTTSHVSSPRSVVIGVGRPAASVAFESEVVAFFVDAAELLGVPKSLAAIYGIVFASPAPLSFADIGARLDLSKGSVSQGLRALREIGAVQEVSRKEDPAELFVPDLEMRRLISRYLASRLDPQLQSGRDRLGSLEANLAAMSPGERKQLAPRLQKLKRWHSRTRALMPLIKTFLRI